MSGRRFQRVYPFFHPVEPLSVTRGPVHGVECVLAGSDAPASVTTAADGVDADAVAPVPDVQET